MDSPERCADPPAPGAGDADGGAPCVLFRLVLEPSGELSLARLAGPIADLFALARATALADPTELFARVAPGDRPRLAEALRAWPADDGPAAIRVRVRGPAGGPDARVGVVTWTRRSEDGRTVWDGAAIPVDVAAAGEIPAAPQSAAPTRTTRDAQIVRAHRLALLGSMSAGMAHELNNPLAYLTANLTFVEEELEGARPADPQPEWIDLEEAVAESREGLARLTELVRQLRRFPRRESGEARPLELAESLDGAARLTWHALVRQVRLECEYRADASVVAEESELVQVFTTLIANAAEASVAEGASERVVRVVTEPAGTDAITTTVSDAGPGIPPDHLERVFEPFFTTKPPGEASGLGLAAARRIVSALGGDITPANRPAGGAAVRVELPARPRPIAARPIPILVLEFELSTLEVLQRALRGHSASYVWTYDQAQERLGREGFGAFVWAVREADDARRVYDDAPPPAEILKSATIVLAPTRAVAEELADLPCAVLEKPVDAAAVSRALERVA